MTELLTEVKVNYNKTTTIEKALHTLKDFFDKLPDEEVFENTSFPLLLFLYPPSKLTVYLYIIMIHLCI